MPLPVPRWSESATHIVQLPPQERRWHKDASKLTRVRKLFLQRNPSFRSVFECHDEYRPRQPVSIVFVHWSVGSEGDPFDGSSRAAPIIDVPPNPAHVCRDLSVVLFPHPPTIVAGNPMCQLRMDFVGANPLLFLCGPREFLLIHIRVSDDISKMEFYNASVTEHWQKFD